MSTLASVYSYLQWAKEHDQNGKAVRIINMLTKRSALMRTAHIMEGNQPLGHKTEQLTGLPTAVIKRFNKGFAASQGSSSEVTFEMAQFATKSQIDRDLAMLGGNPGEARMRRADRYMEALTQTYETQMFYGANGDEAFPGFAAYYSSLTGSNISENVITASGASGSQCSSYFVSWGMERISQAYPKGFEGGVEHIDASPNGPIYQADIDGTGQTLYFVDEWRLWASLVLEDWRYGVRVCNQDVSDLNANTSGYLETVLRAWTKAYYRLPEVNAGTRIYAPRLMAEMLHNAAVNRATGTLTVGEFEGRPVTKFIGIPIEYTDNLLLTESVVS